MLLHHKMSKGDVDNCVYCENYHPEISVTIWTGPINVSSWKIFEMTHEDLPFSDDKIKLLILEGKILAVLT